MRGEHQTPRFFRAAATLAAVAMLSATVASLGTAEASGRVRIDVLSNRADLISGGDALVAVRLPRGSSGASMDLNGKDVTRAFAVRPNGKFEGLVKGLRNGRNVLTARLPNGSGARIDITSHPIGGPVFAGPQIQPWTCAAGAKDKQCNRAPRYEWLYMSTRGGQLQSYDPNNPPNDVANTTTDNGATVPYIVRQEIGAIDRDEYRIAVLYDPKKPWSPWAPQPGFNHKLVITHGASCDTSYAQGSAPNVLNTTALSRGFAVMSHALDNAGHNCNIVTQAESLVMTKEYLIERYGELRYTIGSGCSGGSLVQQQVANAYPGIYQGISPQCSFPDAWSSAMQYEDFFLLREYLEAPQKWAPGVAWTPVQMGAVEGHPNFANAITFTEAIPDSGNPTRPCPGLDDSKVYDKETNPRGVRCTLQDYMVNVFGRRKQDGFAQIAWDNVGVQYGLLPLMTGTISPAQFVDLNTKIGGWDINKDASPKRVPADRFALGAVYRSGAVNVANNLDEVAIIDLRGPDPGAFHDVYRTYAVRSRLFREHGNARNQMIWRGFVPLIGDSTYVNESILALDRWLTNVEKDRSKLALAEKLVKAKPKDLVDRCTNGFGVEMPTAACDAVVESYSSPRIAAGMPFTDDVMKCALKPLRPSDYYPIKFTRVQWETLRGAFPSGVCDYSKPGIGKQPTVPWQTYQDAAGRVIYGGRPLGSPPRSRALAAR
ncbi:MAG TPA: DUF6351 family protein [Actinomycetota bacterium]|nr:DUF6351 family protein [Actinomycetota bacterium]